MEINVEDLASLVSGRVEGDGAVVIRGVSGIREASPGDITFVANQKYAGLVHACRASAIVAGDGTSLNGNGVPVIRVRYPDLAFARIVDLFAPEPVGVPVGIHPTAVIAENVVLGKNVSILAHVVVEEGASIGEGTVLYPGVYVGREATLGAHCLVYPHVTVRERTRIGDRVIVHSGTVIGCDGFGYSTIRGVHHKIPQVGTVEIEDDVEIGANVTIDRARFGATRIGKGTKIDNLVQIAHNVEIGEHTCIAAQVGIAGSSRIGSNVLLAGQSGVTGHVEVGDNVILAAKSGVTKDIPTGQLVSGFPAREHDKQQKRQALIAKLPELQKELKALQAKVAELERRTTDD